MLTTECEDVIGQRGEVGSNHEFHGSPIVAALNLFDNVADQVEVQERLAALKLGFKYRGRALEHQVDGPICCCARHIKGGPILCDAGYLAIGTRVIAAQRNDKDV